jgi:hypothetical protein
VDLPVLTALEYAEGPLFRAAFALLVLGLARLVVLGVSDATAAYLTTPDRATFWRKVRLRLTWQLTPTVILRQVRPELSGRQRVYHMGLCGLSLVMRVGAVLVPAFMLAHVYLWEGALGVRWPALPGTLADVLSVITILAGFLLFLGRVYSPVLRSIEPGWSFLKPLILILPFLTGFLAMHPLWSPVDYYAVRLLHIVTACVVFVMIPFGRLLSCMHVPLVHVMPEAAWRADGGSEASEPEATVTA